MLLFLYLQFLARCHPYILYFIFILVSLLFYPGLALTVARGEMIFTMAEKGHPLLSTDFHSSPSDFNSSSSDFHSIWRVISAKIRALVFVHDFSYKGEMYPSNTLLKRVNFTPQRGNNKG